MKLGFHTILYSPFPQWLPVYTLEETIKRLHNVGYEFVELAAVRPHAWYKDYGKSERASLKTILKNYNMSVSGITPVIAPQYNPVSINKIEREESLEYLKGSLELAYDLGGEFITCSAGLKIFGDSYDAAWGRSVECFQKLALYAKTLGVKIAIEPIWSSACNLVFRSEHAVKLANDIGFDNVGFAMDTPHVFLERESYDDVVRNYGNRLINVHLEDCTASGDRVAPGQGILGMERIICILKQNGYDGPVCVELLRGNDPDQLAYESFHCLRKLI